MELARYSYKSGFRAALQGGLIAAGVNIAWHFAAVFTLHITGLPNGFAIAVVLSSVLPLLLGSVVYVLLMNNFFKGKLLFYILSIAFAIFSIFPSFQPVLSDGTLAPANFALLTVPMHFVAAVSGIYFIVKKTN
jgi:hypothetical protein